MTQELLSESDSSYKSCNKHLNKRLCMTPWFGPIEGEHAVKCQRQQHSKMTELDNGGPVWSIFTSVVPPASAVTSQCGRWVGRTCFSGGAPSKQILRGPRTSLDSTCLSVPVRTSAERQFETYNDQTYEMGPRFHYGRLNYWRKIRGQRWLFILTIFFIN